MEFGGFSDLGGFFADLGSVYVAKGEASLRKNGEESCFESSDCTTEVQNTNVDTCIKCSIQGLAEWRIIQNEKKITCKEPNEVATGIAERTNSAFYWDIKAPCNYNERLNGSGFCESCDINCVTCSGTNFNECTACKWLSNKLDSGICLLGFNCPSGQFLLFDQCVNCPSQCSGTCDQFGACPSCSSGRPHIEGICCDVEGGEYIDFNDGSINCGTCHESCLTCEGPGANQCLTCPPEKLLNFNTGECLDQCSSAFLPSQSSTTCVGCSVGCSSCSDLQNCETCLEEYELVQEQGYSYCKNPSACFERCESCSGPGEDQCLSCKPGFCLNIVTRRCEDNCPDGQFTLRQDMTIPEAARFVFTIKEARMDYNDNADKKLEIVFSESEVFFLKPLDLDNLKDHLMVIILTL